MIRYGTLTLKFWISVMVSTNTMALTLSDQAASDLNFESALKELERIVHKLEEGRVPLEEAVILYEQGAILKSHCDVLLNKARLKIQDIMQNKDGEITVTPSALQQMIQD